MNRLLGENRVIVSPIAGTTRDSIDTPFEKDGEQYLLIDTAGIRRKSKVNEDIEKFSVLRAVAAIERCDVCLLMIDAAGGDHRTGQKNRRRSRMKPEKGIVVVVNKWDLFEKDNQHYERLQKSRSQESCTFMSYAPSVFISALTGQRVGQCHCHGEICGGKQSDAHTDGAAQQSDHRCDHDEAAAFRQRKTPEDLLCDAGGRQAASLLLQDQFRDR